MTTNISLSDTRIARRTGRGVRVVVVDSGVAGGHPHVGHVATAVRVEMAPDGSGARMLEDNVLDRIGHGTAVAAAIREKAPGCDLASAKVFDQTLVTSAEALAFAIRWSADQHAALINLSLGTGNQERAALLEEAVACATARGSIVVSAAADATTRWLPGSLAHVVGVRADPGLARDTIAIDIDATGVRLFRASPLPRPIPGVPPEKNLSGVSFAVANVTGFLARAIEAAPGAKTIEAIVASLATTASNESGAAS